MSWVMLESVVSSRPILNKPEVRKREGGGKNGGRKPIRIQGKKERNKEKSEPTW